MTHRGHFNPTRRLVQVPPHPSYYYADETLANLAKIVQTIENAIETAARLQHSTLA